MRALISVYDKTGLEAFARGLQDLGWEIVSSGGTSEALAGASIAHMSVEEVTGAPEMLGGRVKTLHPKIHGAILADLDKISHIEDLAGHGIDPFQLVVCNLYPFLSAPGIEMIDVGGPTMVRAAAKNHAHVGVIVDSKEYPVILGELHDNGNKLSNQTRKRLALNAFEHCVDYDKAIVEWLRGDEGKTFATGGDLTPGGRVVLADRLNFEIIKTPGELRYGENPHQHGARYRQVGRTGWMDTMVQHSGKTLSYLNLFDAEAAWRLADEMSRLTELTPSAVAIIKHANACGAALSNDISDAYVKAMNADPISAFGGIVAITDHVDLSLAQTILENPQADVLIAPSYDPDAIELFKEKRKVLRVLSAKKPGPRGLELRTIDGGFLVQEPDIVAGPDGGTWTVVTEAVPDEQGWRDAALAWLVCARTTSNAIVLVCNGQVLGVGAGQQSRVVAAEIAEKKADGRASGGAGASDAFFPFRDGLDAVVRAGVKVVVQPGGSVRDAEVIAAADEQGVAMILTGERHFRH
ncbi:MAG: bifunctional phosphoribosylaminoimidazolecarboxamide formyltransferase/IMP cyclohydrolase [Acidimicrobiales bacterium]|nr:bifunctional phosphoribosylaminoimidazolecarboxamide formyltransferase/IMP cyclohydrolase [Acidimicrobiales bacterium]